MEKAKRFLSGRKYFFIILALILGYEFLIVGQCAVWRTGVVAFEFHALDFGMGFGSFLLPGQVYRWICGAPDETTLGVYHTVLILLFFCVLAAFCEKLLLSADKERRRTVGVLLALFLTGPSTFSIFVTDLGMPEVYWVYLAALFFVFLAYRPLNLLIVPLCVAALMVNYAAIICYVPFFCILILYKYVTEPDARAKKTLLVTFVLCVCVSIGFYAYIAPATMKNMDLSFEEFNALMRSRGVKELTYTDSLLYGHYEEDFPADFYAKMAASPFYTAGEALTPLQRLVNFAVFRVNMVAFHFRQRSPLMIVVPLLAVLPVVALIFRYCIGELKNRQAPGLRRFVFLCMPALFLMSLLVSWPLSFDFFKWIDFAFLPLAASFLYVVYREREPVLERIEAYTKALPFPLVALYCTAYALCVYSAYY